MFSSHIYYLLWGTRWRSMLRHCAKTRKVAGFIPDCVIGIFLWHNPSGRTMALVVSASNRNEYQENLSCGVKAAGAWGWQSYHLHVPIVLKSGSLNLMEPSGPVQAWNGIALPLSLQFIVGFVCSVLQPRKAGMWFRCALLPTSLTSHSRSSCVVHQ
jgi:hypothetical protein